MPLHSPLNGKWSLKTSLTSGSNLVALSGEGRNVSGLTAVSVERQKAKGER